MVKNHVAIISPVDFDNVQDLLRMDTRTGNTEEKVYFLSGIVRCGDCGGNMVRKTVPSGKKKFVYYVCANHKSDKTICSPHCINAEALERSVLRLLNCQIENVFVFLFVFLQLEKTEYQNENKAKLNTQVVKKK